MSDRSSMRLRAARGLALVLSVSLGSLVVVNAQFGCDSPASNPPPPKDAAPTQPESQQKTDAQPQQKPDSEPAVDSETPPVAPANGAEAKPDPTAPPSNSEPVFMPASKSGGDFGSMHFPGEQKPEQQQQHPAPKR